MSLTSSTTARPLGVEGGASPKSSQGDAPIYLSLPVPPSLNKAYANGGGKGARGRFQTKAAKDWKAHAGHVLRAQKPGSIDGPVIVVMNAERRSKLADIDNRVKLLLDFLVKPGNRKGSPPGVVQDDRFVTGFAVAWSPPVKKSDDMVHLVILPACNPVGVAFHPADLTGAVGGWTLEAPQHQTEEGF